MTVQAIMTIAVLLCAVAVFGTLSAWFVREGLR
jgi:hypothetical protein